MSKVSRLETRPCSDCGELHTIDSTKYSLAVHDCATGQWNDVPRWLTDAIRGMSDEERTAWLADND